MPSEPTRILETFPNPNPGRDYLVHIEVPEFTCLCPLTGQPDFATFVIDYVPDRRNVELKSLKLYMWSYRNEGAFHEAVTNRILDDLAGTVRPRYMKVTARWYVRGGIFTTVVAEHRKRGWKPAPRVELDSLPAESPMRG
jgi:7-cyano-7-deazaguanine reductase